MFNTLRSTSTVQIKESRSLGYDVINSLTRIISEFTNLNRFL